MTAFRWGTGLHVGQVRSVNQDNILASDGLFAVADGMGGHRAGEVASEQAIDTLQSTFEATDTDQLVEAIHQANQTIVAMATDNPEFRGMGTTISALALVELDGRDALAVANVGDSRTYLLRAESEDLEQVTEDHSLVATLVRQGQLSEEDMATHPQRNIITRALGIDKKVLVDTWTLEPVKGDRYLLCSDGLFNEVDEGRIASVLRRLAEPDEAAAELVRLANEHGGRDNISVVIVDVVDADTEVPSAPGRDGRVVATVHGESRDGAATEAVPARPTTGKATDTKATGDTTGDETADGDVPAAPAGPKSRLTWRVGAFLLAIVVIGAGTFAAVSAVANGSYFVQADGDVVAIWQGKPGGVLWIEPEVIERPDPPIATEDVPALQQRAVAEGEEFTSLQAARAYVQTMRDNIEALPDESSDEPDEDLEPSATPDDVDAGGGIGAALDLTTDESSPSTTTVTQPATAPAVP